MNKEFVPYELALALKELGFVEPCLATFYRKELSQYPNSREEETGFNATPFKLVRNTEVVGLIADTITAPTFSQAFRWFREKHDLPSEVRFVANLEVYDYRITKIGIEYTNAFYEGVRPVSAFSTYEEAELACLKKLIEIAKNK